MRRTLLAVGSLAIALVLQLVVLNGLHLPGGGVPDLVLVLVATLAVTSGPVRGMVTGFAAGLALDLAPPGSAVLGEYALALCLVGWAAAKLNRLVDRSALRALLALAGVVALAEVLVAGISIALDPAQLSLDHARQVLPTAIGYDLLILPFLLYLSLLARTWAEAGPLDSDLDPASMFAGSASAGRRTRKPRHKQQQPQPRLAFAASRPHDGWVGTGPGGQAAALRHPAAPRGLRPGHGVAGSAAGGGLPRPGLPSAPVNIRFDSKGTGGRSKGFGVIGNPVGAGLGRHPGQHPGARSPLRRGAARFRPHGGAPGGSAAGQAAALLRRPPSRPVSVKFGTRRGDGSVGRLLGTPRPAGTGRHGSPPTGAAALDRAGRTALRLKFGRPAAPRFRTGSLAPARSRPKAEPKFRRGSLAPARSRPKAEPKFRRSPPTTSPALTTGLAAASGLSQRDLLSARRRQSGPPRLHLSGGRRGDGLLGGSTRGLRRPVRPAVPHIRAGERSRPARRPAPSQPRFGYGRRSLLRFLVGHRIGGRWLARRRVGSRGQASLIGRRTGGAR
jgi:rod shape-determining protein MreD